MLVLWRKKGEAVQISGPARIKIKKIRADRVWLAVEAEPEVKVLREELLERTRNLDCYPVKSVR